MCWSASENSGDPFSFSFISHPCFGAPQLFISSIGAPFIPPHEFDLHDDYLH